MSKKPAVFIRPEQAKALIENVKKGQFFSLHFERVAPKCEHCEKSNKAWKHLENCPICGQPLSFERETLAQRGVENPADIADKPNGNGISAKEAMAMNWIKYYDVNAVNKNGVKGAYRSCKLENIRRITINGVEHYVVR